jgi:hypothetical protein
MALSIRYIRDRPRGPSHVSSVITVTNLLSPDLFRLLKSSGSRQFVNRHDL